MLNLSAVKRVMHARLNRHPRLGLLHYKSAESRAISDRWRLQSTALT